MGTTTADRYTSGARFSESDRPLPPDLDVVAAVEARTRRKEPLSRGQPGAFDRELRGARGRRTLDGVHSLAPHPSDHHFNRGIQSCSSISMFIRLPCRHR